MHNPKIQALTLLICYALFVYFLVVDNVFMMYCFSALILPVITIFYFCCVPSKSFYFVVFLIAHSLSNIIAIFSSGMPDITGYYICNLLFILSYAALSIEIAKNIDFRYIINHHLFSIIVLFLLTGYIAYQLLQITNPDAKFGAVYVIEMIYNIVMLLILSFALLNYFHKDNRKAFYILIGAFCIVFAEVLNVAYLYMSKQNLLNFFTISIISIGFYFLFAQAKLNYRKTDKSLY